MSKFLLAAIAALTIGFTWSPQQPVGVGHWQNVWPIQCVPSSGISPRISKPDAPLPVVGSSFEVFFDTGGPAVAIAMLGRSRTFWGPVGYLPWAIPGGDGCAMLVAPEFIFRIPGRYHRQTFFPQMPTGSWFLQLVVYDPQANAAGMTSSGLVEFQVGM